MDTNQTDQSTPEDTRQRDALTDAQEPRGNPETDGESVRKGKEQLDKVSGN